MQIDNLFDMIVCDDHHDINAFERRLEIQNITYKIRLNVNYSKKSSVSILDSCSIICFGVLDPYS